MKKRKYNIIGFLAIFLLLCEFYRFYPVKYLDLSLPKTLNNESKLASGQKLKLKELNIIDLEMLPGVSGVLAERIFAKKEQVQKLSEIKGIGKVKSEQIEEVAYTF